MTPKKRDSGDYMVQQQDQMTDGQIDLTKFSYRETTDGGKTWFYITHALLIHELKALYPLSYTKVLADIESGKTHWVEEWNGKNHGYRRASK
jgi:hypothetical protein